MVPNKHSAVALPFPAKMLGMVCLQGHGTSMLHNAVNYCPGSPDGSDGAACSSWIIKRSIWCIAWFFAWPALSFATWVWHSEGCSCRPFHLENGILACADKQPRKKYTHVDKIHWRLGLILKCQCQACDTCAQIGQASYTGANVASAKYMIITFKSCHIALTLMDWLQH